MRHASSFTYVRAGQRPPRARSHFVGCALAAALLSLPGGNVLHSQVAAQPAAEAAYERVAKAWSGLSSLEAQFEQRINNPLVGRTLTSRGVFQQQRPNRIAITFTDPAGDRIVADGKSLWVYLPSSAPGQVLKLPPDADGAIVADLLGQLFETPRQSFAISGGDAASIDGKATRRVQLAPRTAGALPFTRAVVWIDESASRPARVQITDGQGVERTITMTSWTPNATIPASAFKFSPPKGARVLTKIPGV